MNGYNKILIIGFTLVSGYCSAQDLEVVSAAGGYEESTGGSLSYTVGEVMTLTAESTENHLTQGFQQSIIAVLSVDALTENLEISLYPNPTHGMVTVKSTESTELYIYDAVGRLINSLNLTLDNEVDLTIYERGIYQFVFTKDGNLLKTIKVVNQ